MTASVVSSDSSVVRNNDASNDSAGVMSSFRPANNAKLYASPEDMKAVGYRSRSLPAHSARPQVMDLLFILLHFITIAKMLESCYFILFIKI